MWVNISPVLNRSIIVFTILEGELIKNGSIILNAVKSSQINRIPKNKEIWLININIFFLLIDFKKSLCSIE